MSTTVHGVPAEPGPQLVYTTRHTPAGPQAGWACLACGWWHPQPAAATPEAVHAAGVAAKQHHTATVCAARQHQP